MGSQDPPEGLPSTSVHHETNEIPLVPRGPGGLAIRPGRDHHQQPPRIGPVAGSGFDRAWLHRPRRTGARRARARQQRRPCAQADQRHACGCLRRRGAQRGHRRIGDLARRCPPRGHRQLRVGRDPGGHHRHRGQPDHLFRPEHVPGHPGQRLAWQQLRRGGGRFPEAAGRRDHLRRQRGHRPHRRERRRRLLGVCRGQPPRFLRPQGRRVRAQLPRVPEQPAQREPVGGERPGRRRLSVPPDLLADRSRCQPAVVHRRRVRRAHPGERSGRYPRHSFLHRFDLRVGFGSLCGRGLPGSGFRRPAVHRTRHRPHPGWGDHGGDLRREARLQRRVGDPAEAGQDRQPHRAAVRPERLPHHGQQPGGPALHRLGLGDPHQQLVLRHRGHRWLLHPGRRPVGLRQGRPQRLGRQGSGVSGWGQRPDRRRHQVRPGQRSRPAGPAGR